MSDSAAESARPASPPTLETWFTPGKFGLGLALLIIALFPSVFFGTEVFCFRDFRHYGYPLAHHLRESFWAGEVPLWNPLNACGLPFLAQWSTLACYPLSLLFILLPLSWGIGLFCLGHLWLAGFGMYLLARRWSGCNFAAALAGLCYVFNGFTLSCLIWPHYLVFLGWAPVVFLWTQRAWQEGGRAILLAALAGAMQMFSGMPEFILFFWLLLAVWWLAEAVRRAQAWRPSLGRLTAVVLLVAGLAAVQILPFLELFRQSERDVTSSHPQWSVPLSGWGNFLLPLHETRQTHQGATGKVFAQVHQYLFSSYYFPLLWIPLAALAVWRQRRGTVLLLGGIIGLSYLLALGPAGPVYNTLKAVFPPVAFMRYPVKFLFPMMFCLPLLVAMVLPRLLTLPAADRPRFRLLLLAVGGLCLAAMGWLLQEDLGTFANKPHLSFLKQNALLRAGLLVAETFLVLQLAGSGSGRTARQVLFGLGLAGLLWIDVATHLPNQNPTVVPGAYTEKLSVIENLRPRPRPGESRVSGTRKLAQERDRMLTVLDFLQSSLCFRMTFDANINLVDNIPVTGAFYSLYLRHYSEVAPHLSRSETEPRPFWADFLGVSHCPSATNALAWDFRPSFMPLLTAGQKPVFVPADKSADLVGTNTLDPRTSVFLPEENRAEVRATNLVACTVTNRTFSAHRVGATVESAEPALVVVAQAYYPAWRAYVDGQPVPLWRANHAFQALEIPAGRHEVEIRYEDRMFRLGLAITGGTLALCVLGWIMLRRRT